eukprot:6954359-Prymnesium_polylepis.1
MRCRRRRARSVYTARRLKLAGLSRHAARGLCCACAPAEEGSTMTCTISAYGWCGLWAEDAGARPGCVCRVPVYVVPSCDGTHGSRA